MDYKTGECSEEERELLSSYVILREMRERYNSDYAFDEVLKQFGMNVNVEIKMNYLY